MYTLHLCQLHCFLIPCLTKANGNHQFIHLYTSESRSFRCDESCTPVCIFMRDQVYMYTYYTFEYEHKRTGKYAISHILTLWHISIHFHVKDHINAMIEMIVQ